jgi:hypothetical protein
MENETNVSVTVSSVLILADFIENLRRIGNDLPRSPCCTQDEKAKVELNQSPKAKTNNTRQPIIS